MYKSDLCLRYFTKKCVFKRFRFKTYKTIKHLGNQICVFIIFCVILSTLDQIKAIVVALWKRGVPRMLKPILMILYRHCGGGDGVGLGLWVFLSSIIGPRILTSTSFFKLMTKHGSIIA